MAKKTVEPELGTVQVGIADFQRTRDSVSLFQSLVMVFQLPCPLFFLLQPRVAQQSWVARWSLTSMPHYHNHIPAPHQQRHPPTTLEADDVDAQ